MLRQNHGCRKVSMNTYLNLDLSYDHMIINEQISGLSLNLRGSKPKVVITFNQYYLLSVYLVMLCSQEKFASCFSKIKERNPDEFKSITEQLMQHLQNNIEVELSWPRCIESLPVHNLIQCFDSGFMWKVLAP